METIQKSESEVDQTAAAPQRPGRGHWYARLLVIPLASALAVVGATGVVRSVAEANEGGPGAGWHGGHHGAFIAKRVKHLMDVAGASDAQRAQVKQIWEGLRPQLRAARGNTQAIRRQITQALAAPTIDPTQIEQLRKQSVQAMDQMSALVTQGVVASANVLTPDQRQKVLAEIEKHMHELPGAAGADGAGE